MVTLLHICILHDSCARAASVVKYFSPLHTFQAFAVFEQIFVHDQWVFCSAFKFEICRQQEPRNKHICTTANIKCAAVKKQTRTKAN